MATVPIEIVLQDAETPVDPTPTPTPENGEETNIIVPSTGTISNDGDSNGGIGSAASIILPAIIAVLALSAMVASLIHRQQKRKRNNEAGISKKEKLATAVSGTIAILAATVLVGNLVIPATNAATSVAPGTAELETEDKITITATRTADSDEAVVATVKNTSYATANLDFGYKVTASMAEGLTTANLYLDGDETSEYYIAPVEDGTLADNTWGYTLEESSGDTTYLPISLANNPTTIVKGANEIEDEPVDIYYTIKVDKSLPAGTYAGELEYTIAPAVEYMQDFATMTEAEKTVTLANMPEGEQYILKDIRDEKPYYISKLADGNVWMTQNLDFDIVKGGADINSINTDVPEDWADAGNLANTYATDTTTWNSSNVAPESYDPGNFYWDGTLIYDKATCEANGGTWMGWTCADADVAKSIGDSHYHLGNYYNWTAAAAMSDSSSYGVYDEETDSYLNSETNQSICPAGWTLPKGGGQTGPGSFYDLVSSYGWDDSSRELEDDLHIWENPLYFVPEGRYGGSLNGMGMSGKCLSSAVNGSSGVNTFEFTANDLSPSSTNSRDNGYPVRCVARFE